jgi:hypothetical protein
MREEINRRTRRGERGIRKDGGEMEGGEMERVLRRW